MSKSHSGRPALAVEVAPARVGSKQRRRKNPRLRAWQRKNGPVTVVQLERCPQCRQWMRDEHRC